MFEDLITEKDDSGVVCSADTEAAISQEERIMYDLLGDLEEITDEMNAEMASKNISCIWCGRTRGQMHDPKCFFSVTRQRLDKELEELGKKIAHGQ